MPDITTREREADVKYEIRLTGVPDGAYSEWYICTRSNGDGNPDEAKRVFPTRRQAERVVRELYASMRRDPDSFEPEMTAEIIEIAEAPHA